MNTDDQYKDGPPVRIDPATIPSSRPARLDSRRVTPLPKHMQNAHCMSCDKPQAKWRLRTPRPHTEDEFGFLCSLCLLYATRWGKENRRQVRRIIEAIERHGGFLFLRTSKKKLGRCADADRVMGAIAYTSKLFDRQDEQAEEVARRKRADG